MLFWFKSLFMFCRSLTKSKIWLEISPLIVASDASIPSAFLIKLFGSSTNKICLKKILFVYMEFELLKYPFGVILQGLIVPCKSETYRVNFGPSLPNKFDNFVIVFSKLFKNLFETPIRTKKKKKNNFINNEYL